MRIAILDLGTNTFNLLIADETANKEITYLHSSKEPVKLGEGGINNNILLPEAIERALKAIRNHFDIIDSYKAEKVYAYATSAVRDAENSQEFLDSVKAEFDLYINIIPGDREAELIYKGVRQACNLSNNRVLILDIGGGSIECIISDNQRIYWKASYDLGMARLLEQFLPEDPISKETVHKVEIYLESQLRNLFRAFHKYDPETLIGASGSFETFYAIVENRFPEKYKSYKDQFSKRIYQEDYYELHQQLLQSTLEERKKMPGMEPVRIEKIVLATIFVNFILQRGNVRKLMLSEFALKEGVIAETLNI